MKTAAEIRAEWLACLLSTDAADRPRAGAAVRDLYVASGFEPPAYMCWFDSPCAAAWAVALLIESSNSVWAPLLRAARQRAGERKRIERARAQLSEQFALPRWEDVVAAAGPPATGYLQYIPGARRLLATELMTARVALYDDISKMFVARTGSDRFVQAEDSLWGSTKSVLSSGVHCPTTGTIISVSFFADYSFSMMAADQTAGGDKTPPPLLQAAWTIARTAGAWWPFVHAAVLTDRPSELHLNEQGQLHRADGPAAIYRDGWQVYAWNGKAVPERWILQPETVPLREVKGFDPSFRKYFESRLGQAAAPTKKRAKPGSILKAALPADPIARLEQLRAYAGGRLPLFDRYRAGEHQKVWSELVALGGDVRSDPHGADALAVAYETMRRVEVNVRTIVERLQAMNYAFTTDVGSTNQGTTLTAGSRRIDLEDLLRTAGGMPQLGGLFGNAKKMLDMLRDVSRARSERQNKPVRPHVPPDPASRKALADFEKEVGTLPLSLRAFYEVVGEVNLVGHHPTLAPRNSEVAPDPLVVYGFDQQLTEIDDEDDDHPSAITIAPDDLHKADTSGGDPYEMTIPDPRADGELLNERHNLFFVDYLRLCCHFGGFPGYDGVADVPAELGTLSEGLIDF